MARRSAPHTSRRTRALVAARRRRASPWNRTAGREWVVEPDQQCTSAQAEELWDHHGTSAYAMARALLGDEVAAARAVTLGMTDFARSAVSVAADDVRRAVARHVYWRSQELAGETSRTMRLPASMVYLGQLAQLQRACLALCLFGGLTHREAAGLLGVPPLTVARSLTSGITELGLLTSGG